MENNLYSIGDLEKLSGIKAHTIRIWEQRYNLLTPTRSDGNTRYYAEDQLMKLLNVAFLNQHGFKISKIANYQTNQLNEEVSKIAISETNEDAAIHNLLLASIDFDQDRIKEIFDEYTQLVGTEGAFTKIIFPFLRTIGHLWVSGKITPGQEHFFTNLCRQQLFSKTEQLPSPNKKTHILLILPEWDFHELGILFSNYVLRKRGFKTTYLGQAVPVNDAVTTCEKIKPDYIVCTFIGPTSQEQIKNYLKEIIIQTQHVKLLVSGAHIDFDLAEISSRIQTFKLAEEIIAKMTALD